MLTEEPTSVGNVLRHLIAIARQLPKIRSKMKPSKVQDRILRRIIEKRQAQANHKKHGRSEDFTSMHITLACTSKCMKDIRKKRYAA